MTVTNINDATQDSKDKVEISALRKRDPRLLFALAGAGVLFVAALFAIFQ